MNGSRTAVPRAGSGWYRRGAEESGGDGWTRERERKGVEASHLALLLALLLALCPALRARVLLTLPALLSLCSLLALRYVFLSDLTPLQTCLISQLRIVHVVVPLRGPRAFARQGR